MAGKKFLYPIDMSLLEIRSLLAEVLASDPGTATAARLYYNSGDATFRWGNGTTFVKVGRLDQISAPTASVDVASQKITSLANGTAGTDAVNKGQLDNAVAGLSWKTAVRAATTAAGTLATSFENADAIDGVTLATGDRILIKNQAAGAENGIYTVNASGAPTRATDADTAAEILQAAVFVEEGTTNADTGWTLTTNAPITLGTTALTFAQFTGGSFTAGAGLTSTGSTVDVIAGATPGSGGPGGGLKVNADDVVIDTAVVVRKFAVDVGNGALTSITVTHNLNTKDVTVGVYDNTTPFAEMMVEVQHATVNTITLIFAVAPTTNQYRCVVHG